ncbi:MAG: methyltransferase domain-containing protein [Alphaproteobacteria bacterium]|nr:methyltransferase domain-containing protein [Alphaproteobacteria bacterium]
MYLDITELREFYGSPLGRTAQLLIRARLLEAWPSLDGGLTVGLGYAGPLLRGLDAGNAPPLLMMPAEQGVGRWPRGRPNRAALVDDTGLPLPDACVDRLVVCHALEHADDSRRLVRELWRVLAPEGRLLVVVPHRGSPWSFSDRTPFGQGRPYSVRQISRLLGDGMLEPLGWLGALHAPPAEGRLGIRLLRWAEAPGARLWPGFAGVLLVEARKVVEARIGGRRARPALAYARA